MNYLERIYAFYETTLGKRLVIMVLIILVIGVLGYLTREVRSMQWLIENESRMRGFVREYPWQGWLLGFGVYTTFSMVPGTWPSRTS